MLPLHQSRMEEGAVLETGTLRYALFSKQALDLPDSPSKSCYYSVVSGAVAGT